MSRIPVWFACEGARLAGTLDSVAGASGLLLVSGGDEIRSGAWAGQSLLAARVAGAGHPVFRFDRRGVGDSEGANPGFRGARADLAAAIEAFRAGAPSVRRVIGFGNCDAASALALFASDLPLDGLVLANPWVLEGAGADLRPPSAIRRRYKEKLTHPGEWRRLLSGNVDARKLASGIRQAAMRSPERSLAQEMRKSLQRFAGKVSIVLAERDRTAEAFAEAWGDDPRVVRAESASHSFSDLGARDWLFAQVLAALRAA